MPAWAFNGYSRHLHSLGLLLWAARLGLVFVFLIHISFTSVLTIDNIRARGASPLRCAKIRRETIPAEVLMPYSGIFIFAYVIYHVFDYAVWMSMAPQYHPWPSEVFTGCV